MPGLLGFVLIALLLIIGAVVLVVAGVAYGLYWLLGRRND
jgi:hypothetical protein